MKVFVQGATGVLGRRIVADAAAAGHEAVGLSRSDQGDEAVRSAGGTPARADVFDVEALTKAAEGCEVVIRAATAIPRSASAGPKDFAETGRLRSEGTRALLAAALRVGARVFLQESIVWVARPPDGAPFDEGSPVQADPITAPMIEAEAFVRAAGVESGITATTLRLGNFYAPDAWHTRFIGERLSKHKLPVIGSGSAQTCIVHADDAAAAFLSAASAPRAGLFHVLDDAPVPVGEMFNAFAARLGARAPGRVAGPLARLAVGRYTTEFLTTPMRTSNAPFKEAFGWKPKFPTYRETLDHVVAAWRKEGFLGLGPSA